MANLHSPRLGLNLGDRGEVTDLGQLTELDHRGDGGAERFDSHNFAVSVFVVLHQQVEVGAGRNATFDGECVVFTHYVQNKRHVESGFSGWLFREVVETTLVAVC